MGGYDESCLLLWGGSELWRVFFNSTANIPRLPIQADCHTPLQRVGR